MKKSHYTLKDFKINYPNVVKITWNEKILYNNTLTFLHEMCHNIIPFGHNEACKQLMCSECRTERTNHITKAQLNGIHNTLATTDLHNAIDCNSLTDGSCSIKISSNVFRYIKSN